MLQNYCGGHLLRCADQRLGWRCFASLVDWPCKAPRALHLAILATFFNTLLIGKRCAKVWLTAS